MKLIKISEPHGHLTSNDLTAAEKKCLYAYMGEQGASPSFVYTRFFDKGFDEWELEGIDRIQKDFLSCHHLDVPAEAKFYDRIGQERGLKVALFDLMAEKGMTAKLTVIRRFSAEDWKPFERVGVRQLAENFDAYLEKHLQEYLDDAKTETS